MTLHVRRLEPRDDRSLFRCGNPDLDRFFQLYAGQNQFRYHIGTTYVAVDDEAGILGFVTVTASELTVAHLPTRLRRKLPLYPVPVLRLARLGVDVRAKGQGIGRIVLRTIFHLAHRMAADMGCFGVVVDAKPEAVRFYETLGFVDLDTASGELGDRPQPCSMFIELSAIPRP